MITIKFRDGSVFNIIHGWDSSNLGYLRKALLPEDAHIQVVLPADETALSMTVQELLKQPRDVIITLNQAIMLLGPISMLSLSAHIEKVCRLGEIEAIAQLCCKTEAEMLKTPRFGQMKLTETKKALAHLGLSLGMQF